MSPQGVIDLPTETAANRHTPDAFERVKRARQTPNATTDDTGKTLRHLAAANKLLGLPKGVRIVEAWERGEGEDAAYDLGLENGQRATLADRQLYDPRTVERRIRQAAKRAVPWLTAKEWKPGADAIGNAASPDNATTTEDDETLEFVWRFIEASDERLLKLLWQETKNTDKLVSRGEERNELGVNIVELPTSDALWDSLLYDHGAWLGSDRRLYLRVPKLREYLADSKLPRLTSTQLSARLGRIGFTKPNNSKGNVSMWNADRTEKATRAYLASEPGFTFEIEVS
jgi:hypothetical protein